MTYSPKRTLYRSRNGWLFGVCQGIADYAEISAFWVRLAAVITFFVSGFFPLVLIYIVAAIFMKPAPVVRFSSDTDWAFYEAYSADRSSAIHYIRRKFDNLERRTRRMENVVTDRHYDWQRRFDAST